MATEKRLLVRTPQTTDGTTLAYDEDKKPVYKETTLPVTALKNHESLNGQLPVHLRSDLSVVDVDVDELGNETIIPSAPTKGGKGKAGGDGTGA